MKLRELRVGDCWQCRYCSFSTMKYLRTRIIGKIVPVDLESEMRAQVRYGSTQLFMSVVLECCPL